MAATLNISIGLTIAIPIMSSVLIRCCIMSEISAISINAKRNIQTKKEIPNAITEDFTIDEIKNAYRQIFESGLPIRDSSKKLLDKSNSEYVKKFSRFIVESKRGIPFKRKTNAH